MIRRFDADIEASSDSPTGELVTIEDLVCWLRRRKTFLPPYQPGNPELYGHSNGHHELIAELLWELGER